MARIINFPHRQAPGGHTSHPDHPLLATDGSACSPSTGTEARKPVTHSRQPCADEMLRAARQFPDLYLVREPRDYAERFTFVPSDPPPLTFAGKLLDFMRLNGEAISFFLALATIALLVGTVGGAFIEWLA